VEPNVTEPATPAAPAAPATTAAPAAAATPPADPAAAAPAAPATAAPAATTAPAVPEKYEDFKLPDGVKLDTELMGEFGATAKELGLTQEQAQRVADLGAKLSQKNAAAVNDAVEQAKTEWIAQSKTDKEIGGEKFDANAAEAKAVFDAFGTPELGKLLVDSGLGNHPEMLRWAYRVSKQISPDKIHTGRQSGQAVDAASVLYR
jgi:hypothetical protein